MYFLIHSWSVLMSMMTLKLICHLSLPRASVLCVGVCGCLPVDLELDLDLSIFLFSCGTQQIAVSMRLEADGCRTWQESG